MAQAAQQILVAETSLTTGTVIAAGDPLTISTDCSVIRATRAISCLVAIEERDLVLIAINDGDQNYVLAVLERAQSTPLRISTDRQVVIESSAGKVQICAEGGLELSSRKSFDAVANTISFTAPQADFVFEQTTFVGSRLIAHIGRLKTIFLTIETVAESVIENFARLFRRVSEHEQVVARNLDYRAQDTLSFHGRNALLTAEQLAKIDSEQIHLG